MKDIEFALTLILVGMGTTFITLWLLKLVCEFLKKIFPYREGSEK